jgi:hypothetical protein
MMRPKELAFFDTYSRRNGRQTLQRLPRRMCSVESRNGCVLIAPSAVEIFLVRTDQMRVLKPLRGNSFQAMENQSVPTSPESHKASYENSRLNNALSSQLVNARPTNQTCRHNPYWLSLRGCNVDWLTFFSEIVKALAWPGTIITLLVLLRKELPTIAKSLRKLKIKGVELEFGAATKAVATEVKDAVPPTTANARLLGHSKDETLQKLKAVSDVAPRAAILEAWLQVEAAAAELIRQSGVPTASLGGPMRLRDMLLRIEALNPKQIAVFEDLRKLRNHAVHVPEAQFTPAAVENYIDAALTLATYLEDLTGK